MIKYVFFLCIYAWDSERKGTHVSILNFTSDVEIALKYYNQISMILVYYNGIGKFYVYCKSEYLPFIINN